MKHLTELAEECAKLQDSVYKEISRNKDNNFNHDLPSIKVTSSTPKGELEFLEELQEAIKHNLGWAKHHAYRFVADNNQKELEAAKNCQAGYIALLTLYKNLANKINSAKGN